MKTIGNEFLEKYSQGLINTDSELMATLFHKGLSYSVNDELREGAESLSEAGTL